ncbi:Abi-alpha family protein [Ekhidna sp.]|uniref:Abi-alpha family protein n=1 Tax=Ekhidna sp. TaxID=2608089 RepID=UPI003CCC3303
MSEKNNVGIDIFGIGELSKNSMEILKLIYPDVLKPGLSQVGKALGDVLEFSVLPTLLLKGVSEKAKIHFIRHMDKYREKMSGVQESEVIEPPTEISLEILEHLSKVKDEKLADLFIDLLSKASNKATVSHIHPRYVYVLKQISSDEAIILRSLMKRHWFPILKFKTYDSRFFIYLLDENCMNDIKNKKAISLYWNNLESLGILKVDDQVKTEGFGVSLDLKSKIELIDNYINPQTDVIQRYIQSGSTVSQSDGEEFVSMRNTEHSIKIDQPFSYSTCTQFGINFLYALKIEVKV